ncbi:MAG: CHASE2 domain-containing protein [Pseudomonadota bacterium]
MIEAPRPQRAVWPGMRMLLWGIVFGAMLASLQAVSLGQRIEHGIGLPWLYLLRGAVDPPDGAMVVGLDDDGAEWAAFHAPEPGRVSARLDACLTEDQRDQLASISNAASIPRYLYACVLDELAAAGARVVIFDVVFRREGASDERDPLVEAIARAREAGTDVVLLEGIDPQAGGLLRRERPSRRYREPASATGMFRVGTDSTGLVVAIQDRLTEFPDLASLPGSALALYLTGRVPEDPSVVASHAAAMPWFYGPPGSLPKLTLRMLFEDDAAIAAARKALRGKAVFVGLADPSRVAEKDHFRTVVTGGAADAMPGVEIVATVFLNRLEGRALMPICRASCGIGVRPELVLTFVLGVIGVMALRGRSGWRSAITITVIVVAVMTASVGLFILKAVWWPVMVPIGGLSVLAVTAAFLGYARTRESMDRRLQDYVAKNMLKADGQSPLPEFRGRAAVLFVDIAGSTGLAEKMGADRYAAALLPFQRASSGSVEAEGGIPIEIEGDSLLAAFPEKDEEAHPAAARACMAALDIHGHAERASGLGDDGLKVRLGIAWGDVVIGEFEAGGRMALRVIGDPVSSAERLQRLAKDWVGRDASGAAVSDEVHSAAQGRVGAASFTRKGEAALAGRAQVAALWELILRKSKVDELN